MQYYYHTPMMNRGDDWGVSIFMLVFWVVVLGLITYVVLRLIKSYEKSKTDKTDPIDIAKERYARGEINEEQLEQIKKHLK